MIRFLLWRLVRRLVSRARLLALHGCDWLVAYRGCGCIAGAVRATAGDDAILEFAADCEREGYRVEPLVGDLVCTPCLRHQVAGAIRDRRRSGAESEEACA